MMWLPGHVVIGLLLSFPIIVISLRRGERKPMALAYVGFFSILPDFLHFSILRPFSHSLIGATVMLIVSVVALTALHEWRPWLAVIACISMISHLLADTYIGHVYPWYPFSMDFVQFNQFNTLFAIRTEIALITAAIIPFTAILLMKANKLPRSKSEVLACICILGLFNIQGAAQIAYFYVLNLEENLTLSSLILFSLFCLILLLAFLALIREGKSYSKMFSEMIFDS
ncbi:MAG: hypothetical protein QW520_05110 [Methanomassiliicoccales archaeon]